jgi:hypothetical protein
VIGFGMGVIAAMPVACGGVTVDRRTSGGTGGMGTFASSGGRVSSGGEAGSTAAGGTSIMTSSGGTLQGTAASSGNGLSPGQCRTNSDCLSSSLAVLCPDGKYSYPNTSVCVAGRCVSADPHPCTFSDGGLSSSGGRGGDGGANTGGTGGSPGSASIRFDVTGPDPYCVHGCAPPQIEIEDPTGHALDFAGWCSFDCSTCSPSLCPAVPCLPDSIVTMGALDWDGGYYVTSSCGSGRACTQKTFAKPGRYRAKFCATPGNLTETNGMPQCLPSGAERCGSIEFDFPSKSLVTGTVGDMADGG